MILTFSHSVFYFIGSVVNRQVMLNSSSVEFKKINSKVNLGRYIEYRDIALQIKSESYDSATCAAELGASSMYDDLKSCFANNNCEGEFAKKVQNVAPEVLGEAPLVFVYRDIKNGIKSCEEKTRTTLLKANESQAG